MGKHGTSTERGGGATASEGATGSAPVEAEDVLAGDDEAEGRSLLGLAPHTTVVAAAAGLFLLVGAGWAVAEIAGRRRQRRQQVRQAVAIGQAVVELVLDRVDPRGTKTDAALGVRRSPAPRLVRLALPLVARALANHRW